MEGICSRWRAFWAHCWHPGSSWWPMSLSYRSFRVKLVILPSTICRKHQPVITISLSEINWKLCLSSRTPFALETLSRLLPPHQRRRYAVPLWRPMGSLNNFWSYSLLKLSCTYSAEENEFTTWNHTSPKISLGLHNLQIYNKQRRAYRHWSIKPFS